MNRLTAADPETRSADLPGQNLQKLESLFPAVFTQGKIDFDALKQILGADLDESNEKYGLTWHGKRHSRQIALTPSTGTLLPCPDESVDWHTTRNVMIEGDNLEVLKLLQKSYATRVKLIYIDPPYNTGNDFIYPDDFKDSIGNYLSLTRQVDGSHQKLSSQPETSGRFHTNWLNMMYPRLKLARNLLRDDGLLISSVSDAEVHHLRQICDELFGSENLIGCVIWHSTKSVTNTALISVSHTYNLVYAKNQDYFVANRPHFRLTEDGSGFSNPDNDPRGPWKADPFQVDGERPNQLYPIVNPHTGKTYRPNPGCSWKNEHKVFKTLLADSRMVFGVHGQAGPQRKRFLSEAKNRGRVSTTLWTDLDTTTNATRHLKALMGSRVFSHPKPVELLRRFIQLGIHDPDDAIVLDFFAGSGTTAQAVMAQNAADGGTRRYILVQLPERLPPTTSEYKAAAQLCDELGYRPTIAEICKERMRRSAAETRATHPDFAGDLGFRVFKLDTSNIRTWELAPEDLERSLLDNIEHVKAGRTDADLLFEVLLKLGIDLSAPLESRTIAGKLVSTCGNARLFTCFEETIGRAEAEPLALGIAQWWEALGAPADAMALFRDGAFPDDVTKLNLAAILEQSGIGRVRSL